MEVHVVGRDAFVWSPGTAQTLREKHRIVGNAVGGMSAYRQQNVANGLPLLLSPEETTLLLEKGLIVTVDNGDMATRCRHMHFLARKRQRQYPRFDEESADDSDEAGSSDSSGPDELENPQPWPAWKEALADSLPFEVPHLPENWSDNSGRCSAERRPVDWQYPSTRNEVMRYAVFKDLHDKGYFITNGAKFGADYLAYPGDPFLYHAQFCVRVINADAQITGHLYTGAARAAHGARKHMLLSVVSLQEDGKKACGVQYVTVGPEGGFGFAM